MNVNSILPGVPSAPSAASADAWTDDRSEDAVAFDDLVTEAQEELDPPEPARLRADPEDQFASAEDGRSAAPRAEAPAAGRRKPADKSKSKSDAGAESPTPAATDRPSEGGEKATAPAEVDKAEGPRTPRAAVMLAQPEGDAPALPGSPAGLTAAAQTPSPTLATTPTASAALVLQTATPTAAAAAPDSAATPAQTAGQAQPPKADPAAAAQTPAAPDRATETPAQPTNAAVQAAAAPGQKTAAPAQFADPALLATAGPEIQAPTPREGRDAAKSSKSGDGKVAAASTPGDANAASPTAKPAAAPGPAEAAAAKAVAGDAAAKPEAAAVDAAKTHVQAARASTETVDGAELRRAEAQAQGHAPERAAPASRPQIIDLAALATRFAARAKAGATSFSIRLDPPELGRVDVKLEVAADGTAHARLAAERPEALAELSRHSRALERALADAGVELARGGLSFELAGRDGGAGQNAWSDGFLRDQAGYDAPARAPLRVDAPAEAPAPVTDALSLVDDAYGFAVLKAGRLDVRI